MTRNVVETIMGAAVLVVAIGFTAYAFSESGSSRPSGYELVARFDRIDGVKRGTDVTLAGVKIGTVISNEIDPKSFMAVVRFAVNDNIALPTDTVARVVSESLLGNSVILLEPGSDEAKIKPGEEISKTVGARSIIEILAASAMGSVNQPKK